MFKIILLMPCPMTFLVPPAVEGQRLDHAT